MTIVVLSNMFSGYINLLTEGIFRSYNYQTENAEFVFTILPAKGRDIKMMERQFSHFKETHPKHKELKLFRTFKRNYMKFWNWHTYMTNEMYQYEYHEKL